MLRIISKKNYISVYYNKKYGDASIIQPTKTQELDILKVINHRQNRWPDIVISQTFIL